MKEPTKALDTDAELADLERPVTDLTHHFLIAMPNMVDSNFERSLVYLCEHGTQGALGLVVNRPLDITLKTLLERLELPLDHEPLASLPVCLGGPVQTDRGFVLHQPPGEWQASLRVEEDIALTSSRDILESVSLTGQPSRVLVCLGYAGWTAGQLEFELEQNAWLTLPASADILFDLPAEQRLPEAIRRLGFDFSQLSDEVGHA